jgi:hypothetical protein
MTSIVRFPGKPEDDAPDGPHMSGEAFCGACGHEWAAVAPVGDEDHMECPNCHRHWGAMKHQVVPSEAYWRCNCGETLFWLTPTGAQCRRCGLRSNDWAD